MGYNMLMADADTGPLYDFYRFIHSPPFNTVQLWIQREGTYAVNSGVYYVRGAARDGPVAYLVAEMVLKNVLWWARACVGTAQVLSTFRPYQLSMCTYARAPAAHVGTRRRRALASMQNVRKRAASAPFIPTICVRPGTGL